MIFITTNEAMFQLKVAGLSLPNQLAMAQRYALRNPEWYIPLHDNGEQVAEFGDSTIVPAVWSHTPFTWGMDAQAIQDKFEKRAVDLLGDRDYTPSMAKFKPSADGHGYKDNRYSDEIVRGAWMMYVDAHIEFFNNK